MIKQDNKLIFDIDKKYIAGKSTVWNNVKRKQLLLNKNIVVYAYIKEIEYNTSDIKVKLNSTDNTETIITLDKTSTDTSGIPEYTTPDAKTDELNYALTLFVNEAYKDFQAGTNITPPPAVDVSEYETRIQELTDELETYKPKPTEIIHTDKVDIQDATFTTIGYANDQQFGGSVNIVLNGDIGDSSVSAYKNIFEQNLDVNNLQVNNQPVTITGVFTNARYVDGGYKDIQLVVNFRNEGIISLSEVNTIKATMVNKGTQATHEITGTFTQGTGTINITNGE